MAHSGIQLLSRNGHEYQARGPKLRVQPRISLRARVDAADLSTAGVAFVSDRVFHTGDLVALMPRVDGQAMRMRARVLHTDQTSEGLTRVGCELAAITQANRERIARLAGQ